MEYECEPSGGRFSYDPSEEMGGSWILPACFWDWVLDTGSVWEYEDGGCRLVEWDRGCTVVYDFSCAERRGEYGETGDDGGDENMDIGEGGSSAWRAREPAWYWYADGLVGE